MARWMLYTKKADFKAIAEDCGISQVLARVIRNRDVVGSLQTRRFLKGDWRTCTIHAFCRIWKRRPGSCVKRSPRGRPSA